MGEVVDHVLIAAGILLAGSALGAVGLHMRIVLGELIAVAAPVIGTVAAVAYLLAWIF